MELMASMLLLVRCCFGKSGRNDELSSSYPTLSLAASRHLLCQPSLKPRLLSKHRHEATSIHLRIRIYELRIAEQVNMINAMLVFNNAGQPRLTKFYTQLVHSFPFETRDNTNRSRKLPSSSA
jgi:hypothetical protein